MEDSPLFNAGKGSVLNHEGFVELDAAIMDGATHRAGAVAAVRRVKNPIDAARAVMERTTHVLLVGAGADAFAEEAGLKLEPPEYFITEERRKQWEEVIQAEKRRSEAEPGRWKAQMGTVGAVALDRRGNLAAGTSTGGLVGKKVGRVGDSPLIGAGTFADNATCAVSATGHGEFFIRYSVAHDVAAQMEYKKLSLKRAARLVVKEKLVRIGGEGGLIAIDRLGNIAMPFNSEGMYPGSIAVDGQPHIAIYSE
jgi:beta-aspartyl-peptidase (threonine type)